MPTGNLGQVGAQTREQSDATYKRLLGLIQSLQQQVKSLQQQAQKIQRTSSSGTTDSSSSSSSSSSTTVTVSGGRGPVGPGVPAGGATGQMLVKASGTDYDTEWIDEAGGGGGSGGGDLVTEIPGSTVTSTESTLITVATDWAEHSPSGGAVTSGNSMGDTVRVVGTLHFSHDNFGQVKGGVLRLRAGSTGGTVIASRTYGDDGDDTSGDQFELSLTGTDPSAASANQTYYLTIQETGGTAGSLTVYSAFREVAATPIIYSTTSTTAAVIGERPPETADGTITDFSLLHEPVAGSLAVYVGADADTLYRQDGSLWSVAGSTLTFTTAPASGSVVLVDYRV